MTLPRPSAAARDAAVAVLGSSRFTAALTSTAIGAAFFSGLIRGLIGWPGLVGVLAGLVLLSVGSIIARREYIEWRGLLPISLIVFVGWTMTTILWSQYQWATLGGVGYQFAFTVLGVIIALGRDPIQIVRAFGDVLRVVLGVSLALEVFSGILIDTPLRFLGIQGDIASLGPIQGVMGSRNQLGLTALIALVTFGTELFTRSVSRRLGILSVVAAAVTLALTQSPVSVSVLAILGLASFALLGLRRMKPDRRRVAQVGLLVVTVSAIAAISYYRARVVAFAGLGTEVRYRDTIWHQLSERISAHPLEGWGWIGPWQLELQPFHAIVVAHAARPPSALNAFIDVWFQLGVVGLIAFLVLIGLAFVRSWIIASQHRSRAYVWLALVLVTLVATSLAESVILTEYAWLTLVVCCVKAADKLSWRQRLPQ